MAEKIGICDPDGGRGFDSGKSKLPVLTDVPQGPSLIYTERQRIDRDLFLLGRQMKSFCGDRKNYNPPESGVFDLIETQGIVPRWAMSFSAREVRPDGESRVVFWLDDGHRREVEMLPDLFGNPFVAERIFDASGALLRVRTVVRHNGYNPKSSRKYSLFTQTQGGEMTRRLGIFEIEDINSQEEIDQILGS